MPPVPSGYDSLQSTPKQARVVEKVELESTNDETEDNMSNSSYETSVRWIDGFSFRNCKLLNRLRPRGHEKRASGVEEPRVEWDKKMDFLLSIIGFAVDLANVSL